MGVALPQLALESSLNRVAIDAIARNGCGGFLGQARPFHLHLNRLARVRDERPVNDDRYVNAELASKGLLRKLIRPNLAEYVINSYVFRGAATNDR